MQAKPSPPSFDEREDKPTQRAVMALLLYEFPTQLTREDLRYTLGSDKGRELEHALRSLDAVDLIWREGDFVLPTLAARHFDWLELS
ncbi:MAG TPA: hypothetical protein VGH58_00860 [Solirubrobacterales bacterium]|jgi:hypothetical protein